jgi:hypothetical protein
MLLTGLNQASSSGLCMFRFVFVSRARSSLQRNLRLCGFNFAARRFEPDQGQHDHRAQAGQDF